MKTLGLSAALVALALTASTACAAVIDFSNTLGPSGRYTSLARYQGLLGGQPVTAAQQAYADQEGQLRLLGFLSESRGDMTLGQMFYHMAYGVTPPSPSGGSDLRPPSSGAGASDVGDTSTYAAVFTDSYTGAGLTLAAVGAVPEPSSWAMMIVGFAGLGFMSWRCARKTPERRLGRCLSPAS